MKSSGVMSVRLHIKCSVTSEEIFSDQIQPPMFKRVLNGAAFVLCICFNTSAVLSQLKYLCGIHIKQKTHKKIQFFFCRTVFCKVLLLCFGAGHEQNVFIWWLNNLSVLNMFADLRIGMSKSPLYSSSKYNTFPCFFSLICLGGVGGCGS